MKFIKYILSLVFLLISFSVYAQNTTHYVEIKTMKFVPEVIEVAVGDSIIWTNKDIVEHNVVSRAEKGWKSENLKMNESFAVKIDSHEDVEYLCTLHPVMIGKVKIQAEGK